MSTWRPKYITFDCYGTLVRFRMGDMTRGHEPFNPQYNYTEITDHGGLPAVVGL